MLDSLDDHTLNLLEVLDVDIAPQHNSQNSNRKDGGGGDKHHLLRITIRLINSRPSRRTHSIRLLLPNISKDDREVCLALLWQILHKFNRHNTSPNSRSDRTTNGTSDGREHTLDSEHNSDILMGCNGQSSDLLGNNEGSAGEGVEDLAHDYVSDIHIWLTKLDHKRNAQDREWDTKVERNWLVAAGVADNETDDNGPKAGSDGVNVTDVSRWGELEVIDDLEHRGEEGVPDVETDEECGCENAGSEDGAVQEEVIGDVGDGGEETLPDCEEDDHDAADGDHGNDEWLPPSIWLVVVDGEWEEEETQSSGDEEESDEIELDAPVHDGLDPGASRGLALGDESCLLGLTLVLQEQEEEWEADGWSDDGERSVAPSPSWALKEGFGEWTCDPDGSDVDGGGECEHETSVAKLGGIGDENTEDVDSSGVSNKG